MPGRREEAEGSNARRRSLAISGGRSRVSHGVSPERQSVVSNVSGGGQGPRKRRRWSIEDEEELERGLLKYQYHQQRWVLIMKEGKEKGFFCGRHNTDLNNKARQMKESRKRSGVPLGGFRFAVDR